MVADDLKSNNFFFHTFYKFFSLTFFYWFFLTAIANTKIKEQKTKEEEDNLVLEFGEKSKKKKIYRFLSSNTKFNIEQKGLRILWWKFWDFVEQIGFDKKKKKEEEIIWALYQSESHTHSYMNHALV